MGVAVKYVCGCGTCEGETDQQRAVIVHSVGGISCEYQSYEVKNWMMLVFLLMDPSMVTCGYKQNFFLLFLCCHRNHL